MARTRLHPVQVTLGQPVRGRCVQLLTSPELVGRRWGWRLLAVAAPVAAPIALQELASLVQFHTLSQVACQLLWAET